jgi:O-antigen/teichoic acid export membrane protein
MTLRRLWESPTFTSWLSTATRAGGWVVVLPIILRRFDAAEVAVWYLFLAILSLQSFGDLGFGQVFIRSIAHALGRLDASAVNALSPVRHAQLHRLSSSIHGLYSLLAAASSIVILAVGTWSLRRPIAALADPVQGWWAWGVIAFGFFVALRGSVFGILLQGLNRVAQLRRVEAIVGLGSIASMALVVLVGGGLLGAALISQAWTVVGVLTYRHMVSLAPELAEPDGAQERSDASLVRSLWPAAWRSGLGAGISRGLVVASGLVYAQFAPAAELAAYMLALRLMLVVTEFSQAPFYSKLPLMARYFAAGETDRMLTIARRGARLSLITFAVLFTLLSVAAQPLLVAIGSSVSWVAPNLWTLIGLAFYSERVGAMHLQLYSTTNHILWHVANGVAGLINLTAVVLLAPTLGVQAFPLGMLAGNVLFYTWYSARLVYRRFSVPAVEYELATSLPPLAMIVAAHFLV